MLFLARLIFFGGSGFEGKIDELKIYNRVLTENEIMAGNDGKRLND